MFLSPHSYFSDPKAIKWKVRENVCFFFFLNWQFKTSRGSNLVKCIFFCCHRKWQFTPVIILPPHAVPESSLASAENHQRELALARAARAAYHNMLLKATKLLVVTWNLSIAASQWLEFWILRWPEFGRVSSSWFSLPDSNNHRNFTRTLPVVHIMPVSCTKIMIYSCLVTLSSTNDSRLLLKALVSPSKWIYAL